MNRDGVDQNRQKLVEREGDLEKINRHQVALKDRYKKGNYPDFSLWGICKIYKNTFDVFGIFAFIPHIFEKKKHFVARDMCYIWDEIWNKKRFIVVRRRLHGFKNLILGVKCIEAYLKNAKFNWDFSAEK